MKEFIATAVFSTVFMTVGMAMYREPVWPMTFVNRIAKDQSRLPQGYIVPKVVQTERILPSEKSAERVAERRPHKKKKRRHYASSR